MSNSTPPHQPTYGVYLSEHEIRRIRELNIRALEPNVAFNNRIYFLDYEDGGSTDSSFPLHPGPLTADHVLKVSGRFWGTAKVENEVSCLLLLERYCSEVPAPRVIAYSRDGVMVHVVDRRASDGLPQALRTYAHSTADGSGTHSWILMTRCAGERLEAGDIQDPHIVKHLARYVAQWRRQFPHVNRIGNIRSQSFCERDLMGTIESFPAVPRHNIAGVFECAHEPLETLCTPLSYSRYRILDQLAKLEANENLAANREELLILVGDFMKYSLPNTYLGRAKDKPSVFTRNDLSLRNILVSQTGQVTGVLDFEFAGFFPKEEEFKNLEVHNFDDWPTFTLEALYAELKLLHVDTPSHGLNKRSWDEAKLLAEVTTNIAPWCLLEASMEGEDLDVELQKAKKVVKDGIAVLTAQSASNPQE
ncbi:hypothetical protein LTS00_017818 [Friedmanniomyces endolithicus]|nr:hypothetical protein LTS00_017818 [Friedmanniomyces endolithicus]